MPYVTEDNLTDVAMERWKDIPDPRLRQIMQSLIKHLHGFVRDIEQGAPGIPCFVTGTVRGLDGEPVAGALLDLWQTDGEGLYEDQRDVKGPWMRGLYRTQPDGSYVIRTVAPIAYTIPMDGTVGELMNRTNISHMRPAHIQ